MTTPASLTQLIDERRTDTSPIYLDGAGARTVTGVDLARSADGWAGVLDNLTRTSTCDVPIVAVAVADPLDFACAYVGLLAAGATLAPLDPAAPPERLHQDVVDLRAQALVSDLPEEPVGLPVPMLGSAPAHAGARPQGRPGSVLLRSSGSTGPRKVIALPEAQLLHVAAAVAGAHGLRPTDVGYSPLPLFHVNAEVVGLLATLVAGGSLVLDRRFSRRRFWPTVAAHRVTWINAVPAVLAILEHHGNPALGRPPGTEHVRFVRSASAPLPLPMLHRFEKTYGIPVVETYGMTEAASQICANPVDARKPGSVGVPVGVALHVRDSRGVQVAPEVTGEVHIRGAGVIDGDLPGGWLATGDVGRCDTDGYLYLTGRVSEVINRGGEKLFPRDIENTLAEDAQIADAVVVAEPDDILGEVPVAYLLAHGTPDAARLAAAARARCGRELSRPQQPRDIHVVAELPRGGTGKISRKQVRELGPILAAGAMAHA